MDRIAPTRRPDGPASGTQIWSELLFLHWTYPAEIVRALVPAEFELDLWEGQAWVGLVPFHMGGVRSSWMPRALGLDFLETNVRTYVHYRGEPGVYFFSLEASSRLAVKVARIGWSLPYYFAEMETSEAGGRVQYRSHRLEAPSADLEVDYQRGELLGPSTPETLEHFLLERYLLFSTKSRALYKGQVHHVPYPAERATVGSVKETLLSAAGLPAHPEAPTTAHYASRVDVEVFGPWKI